MTKDELAIKYNRDETLHLNDFSSGVDTFFDTLASSNTGVFAINTRCKKGRTIDRRLGFQLYNTRGGFSEKVYWMGTKMVFNGIDILLRIVSSSGKFQLQYDNSNGYLGGWQNIGSAFGSVSTNPYQNIFSSFKTIINGEARTYISNGVDNLFYTEGTTLTSITDGSYDIKGRYIAGIENIMVLAGLTSTFAGNQYVVAKAGSHLFRRDVDLTYDKSSYVGNLDDEITGCHDFQWLIYLFTADAGLWELDLKVNIPRRVSDHGTLSPKSIAKGNDMMIWCDDMSIWGLTAGGSIREIGIPVKEIYLSADFSNKALFTGNIHPDGTYHLYIGTGTFEEVAYSDLTLIYDIQESRRLQKDVWRIDNGKKIMSYCNYFPSARKQIALWGSSANPNCFIDDSGTDDDGADIDLTWQSKEYGLATEREIFMGNDLYFKLKPSLVDYTIEVFYRIDLGDWQPWSTMNIKAGEMLLRLNCRRGIQGRTLAIKLKSSAKIDTRIYELLFIYNLGESELRSK
jgi:hypothetical protein